MPAAQPPSLYAYDPDTGRLAVTTRAYNTAIVPVSQHAFPYGGIDLARLFDGEQRVAANVGGRGETAFGVRLVGRGGRLGLASQLPRARVSRRVPPLRLTKAPSGTVARASARVARAYAGPFSDLRATGTVASAAGRIPSAYRFTERAIDARWTVRTRLRARATFPSWGREATVVARLRDGSRRRVTGRPLALARVKAFEIRSASSGYFVIPRGAPRGAIVQAVRPAAQASAPAPGASLRVSFARKLRVRLVPGLSRSVRGD
jgi:hypothetical protein